MNETSPTTDGNQFEMRTDAFLPLVLITISLILIFGFQLNAIMQQQSAFHTAIAQQGEGVKQSRMIQGNLEKLVRDLLDLSQSGDTDAKSVVTKYGIQSNVMNTPGPVTSPIGSSLNTSSTSSAK